VFPIDVIKFIMHLGLDLGDERKRASSNKRAHSWVRLDLKAPRCTLERQCGAQLLLPHALPQLPSLLFAAQSHHLGHLLVRARTTPPSIDRIRPSFLLRQLRQLPYPHCAWLDSRTVLTSVSHPAPSTPQASTTQASLEVAQIGKKSRS